MWVGSGTLMVKRIRVMVLLIVLIALTTVASRTIKMGKGH